MSSRHPFPLQRSTYIDNSFASLHIYTTLITPKFSISDPSPILIPYLHIFLRLVENTNFW